MIKLEAEPTDPTIPYGHLLPITEVLDRSGNLAVLGDPNTGGFYLTQGGWLCDLTKPIDFGLLDERFEFPPTIKRYPDGDTVFCERTWIAIRGMNARNP